MNNDLSTLQIIADTLKEEPMESQRVLAQNSGMSIGLMNAVLKRFVERGWIMLSNVNLRKLSYAVTPQGFAQLSSRSQNFARRTFALANEYNQKLCQLVQTARKSGKTRVILYGPSYIKFLLEYACHTNNVDFIEKPVTAAIDKNALCIVGEQNDQSQIDRLTKMGCLNLLEQLGE